MTVRVLGVNAFRRDPAAAIVVDGEPIAAIQETHLTRKRGEDGFPTRSVRWCLEAAGCTARDLDLVVVGEKPLRRFERTLGTQLHAFPRGAGSFARSMFLWLGDRLWMRGRIAAELEIPTSRVRFVEHARAHVASAAAFASDATLAALVLDDVGEWAATTVARIDGAKIDIVCEQRYPHSLGLVASALTQHLGLLPGEDEAALDLLASRGEPRHLEALRRLCRADDKGVVHVDQTAFPFAHSSERLFGSSLELVLGAGRERGRTPSWSDNEDLDVAASGFACLLEAALATGSHAATIAPAETLVVTGLLARMPRLMASLEEGLRRRGAYGRVVVPPWPDEAGAALGAALVGASSDVRSVCPWLGPDSGAFGGPSGVHPGDSAGEPALEGGAPIADAERVRVAAERVASGQLVGWCAGRLAFGDTSRGSRVAVADPSDPDARARLLGALQRTEDWQRTWLVEDPSDPPFGPLSALVRQAQALGLPGLLVAELIPRGGVLPRVEFECVEAFRRSTLDALITDSNLYLSSIEAAAPAAS